MIQLICIQTYHSHWAGHSGYHHFLNHLPGDIEVTHHKVSRGDIPASELRGTEKLWLKRVASLTKKMANPWTTENDLLVEYRLSKKIRAEVNCGDKIIIHFLDGEIGYNFLGSLRKFFGDNTKNVRLMATFHQPIPWLDNVLPYRKRIKHLDMVLTVGTSQFPFFDYLSQDRLRFVPHGIDTDYFHPSEHLKNHQRVFCLTVGHWLRDFDALEKVVRAAPENLVFRIVAGEEHVERFRKLDNVELYSGVADEKLLELYQGSDIGLMPLEDSTANNGLLEMMACGLPCIATRVGSVADYLTEKAGILLTNNHPDELLDALTKLADGVDSRTQMGKAARNRALELSWDNIAREMTEIYRAV